MSSAPKGRPLIAWGVNPWCGGVTAYQALSPLGAAILLIAVVGCGQRSLPHEGKTVTQLRKMLDHSSPQKQAQGALGLSLHGADAAPAVPRLIELLKSPDTLVRQQSALALGKIGSPAREGVPGLIAVLEDKEWSVRRQAALALGEIGATEAKPALEKRTKDDNALVRKAAVQALERMR
jgi:HEAT repeat protein